MNEEQYDRVVDQGPSAQAGGSVEGVTVAAWGLTFKARTDDLRDSPALHVIDRLADRGARVRAYDPHRARPLDRPVASTSATTRTQRARVPRCWRC